MIWWLAVPTSIHPSREPIAQEREDTWWRSVQTGSDSSTRRLLARLDELGAQVLLEGVRDPDGIALEFFAPPGG